MGNDMLRFGLLAIYVVVSVAGMALLKGAETTISLKSGVGFTLYLAGFLMWTGVILRIMPLSQAFPIAAGSLMLGTQLVGWLIFKERIGLWQLAGVALILSGVAIISMTAQARS
jgi:multidrug transporter EmrE-like cation transporter